MSVLDQLGQWPVDNVAASVVSETGTSTYGDTTREYALASVTKLLVAQAVLVAVEEGAVELHTPAGPPGATVEHLLAHASGLAFDTRDAMAEPGTQRIYSSAGYEVLAETVEKASGIDFSEYLHQAVAEPLQLTSTRLEGPAGHAAVSSVDDLTRFAADLLNPRLLSAPTAQRAVDVAFPGLDGFVPGYGRHRPNDWGLGPEIRGHKEPHWTAPSHSPSTFGHFGQAGTYLWVDPVRRAAGIVLTDRAFGPWCKPLWSEFNEAVVQALDAGEIA